jgi:hypothetical protein
MMDVMALMLSVWEKLKSQDRRSEKLSKFRRQIVKALGADAFFFLYREAPKNQPVCS